LSAHSCPYTILKESEEGDKDEDQKKKDKEGESEEGGGKQGMKVRKRVDGT